MNRTLCYVFFSLCCAFSLLGQTQLPINPEKVVERLWTQAEIFPQEKLHLHLDRTSFFQGEKIWFRAYLTDAFLQPSKTGSHYLYVELINPADSIVQRVMIRPDEAELFHGNLPLEEDLAEGIYTLRAYTRYMENMGEENYFRRKIQVNSVIASQIRPHYTLEYFPEEKKVNVDLYYTEGYSGAKIKPDKLQMHNWRGEARNVRMDKDTVARFAYALPAKGDPQPAIFLEADNFHHYIPLATTVDDYDVAFYPEGGYLMNGSLTRVAFKAVNSAGLPEEITGKLYNSKGEWQAEVKTVHDGMGILGLIAAEEETYYVECVNSQQVKKRFDLPKGISGMYGLQAIIKEGSLLVQLNPSADMPNADELYLLIHRNGEACFFDSFKSKQMLFSWERLPQGILQLMLLDKDLNPLSERLVFSPLREESVCAVKADRPVYSTREKIALALKLEDENGAPLQGDFSVAVTDSRDVQVDSLYTIASTLLLTSELKGKIEDPAFYLRPNDPKATYALDLLLMTQGWRRYNIPQAMQGNYTYPQIPVEKGLQVSGTVTQVESTKPIANGEVTLMLNSKEEESFFDQVQTNERGQFVFDRMEYPDSTTMFIQSLNMKGKDFVQLNMDTITYPSLGPLDRNNIRMTQAKAEEPIMEEEDLDLILKKAEQRAKYDENMQVVNLKEVLVTARKRKTEDGVERSMYASSFTTVIDLAKKMERRHYNTIVELFYEVPGVSISTDDEGNRRLVVRGSTSFLSSPFAAVMVNDIFTDDPAVLESISVHDVATVEVYKGVDATIFGVRGGNGVVNITFKKGSFTEMASYNKMNTVLLGFQRPVEFYAPKYETPQQKSSYLPDLRTTIYWKPALQTNEDGRAQIEFYSADTPTAYDIVVEGLTTDGVPVRKTERITVE